MSVTTEVTAAPKAAITFAKNRPLAFALLALLLVLLTLRYAPKVSRFLATLPLVGKFFGKFIVGGAV